MKKWSELKHTTRCTVVDIACAVLCILLLTFCSCTNHEHCNIHFEAGVVERVEKSHAYTKYKVCVKERGMITLTKFDYYWFYTNDLLQVGDTIHIGKK